MRVEPGNILTLFLNFSNFEPQYSYRLYSYKKKSVSTGKNKIRLHRIIVIYIVNKIFFNFVLITNNIMYIQKISFR